MVIGINSQEQFKNLVETFKSLKIRNNKVFNINFNKLADPERNKL